MRFLPLAILFGSSLALADPLVVESTDAGLTVLGPVMGFEWGQPLAAGDFDHDGFQDLVVVASQSDAASLSQVFIIRGRGALSAAGVIDLSNTAADQVIESGEFGDNLGASVAAGDVNDDQIDDLLLVASGADYGSEVDRGVAYVIYGDPNFFADPVRNLKQANTWDLRLLGPFPGGDMGGANIFGGGDGQAAAIGDVNGDGIGDIILGVHLADGSKSRAGRVYVRFGSASSPSGQTLNLAISNTRNIEIWGAGEADQLGTVVTTGDITGDGIPDLIMGNSAASRGVVSSEGATYVLRGRTTWPTFINLFSTDADITILGARRNDRVGESVAVGDFNNDTIGDLAIAAPGAELGTIDTMQGDGIVYLFFGGAKFATGTLLIDLLSDTVDVLFVGESLQRMGSVIHEGDINQDGFDDLITTQPNGGDDANGVVEVLFGRVFEPPAEFYAGIDSDLRIFGQPDERLGTWLDVSDFNGDSRPEILCAAPSDFDLPGAVYAWYVTGDADLDRDVDAADLAIFQGCVGVPDGVPLSEPCQQVDFTLDGFISADDWPAIEGATQGPWFEADLTVNHEPHRF